MTGTSRFGPREFQAAANVSRETVERLERYVRILLQWQARLNLISESTVADIWERHIFDSAQLSALAPDAALRWADLGSGAGFPGLVIAILRLEMPGFEMHLTERLAAKCEFLRAAIAETGAPAIVHHGKIERLAPLEADVVTARACAPLPTLLGYYQRHRSKAGLALFAKGRNLGEELTQVLRDWTLDMDRLPSRTAGGGEILRIRSASPARK